MKVIIYSSEAESIANKFVMLLTYQLPEIKTIICRTLAEMVLQLRQPRFESVFSIVIIDTGDELDEVLSISTLLQTTRNFLVLPDKEQGTISKCHPLQPRFITCQKEYLESADILKKIVQKEIITECRDNQLQHR